MELRALSGSLVLTSASTLRQRVDRRVTGNRMETADSRAGTLILRGGDIRHTLVTISSGCSFRVTHRSSASSLKKRTHFHVYFIIIVVK